MTTAPDPVDIAAEAMLTAALAAEDEDGDIVSADAHVSATAALTALHLAGWRIVRSETAIPTFMDGQGDQWTHIYDEWLPGVSSATEAPPPKVLWRGETKRSPTSTSESPVYSWVTPVLDVPPGTRVVVLAAGATTPEGCTCGPIPNDGRYDDPACPHHGATTDDKEQS